MRNTLARCLKVCCALLVTLLAAISSCCAFFYMMIRAGCDPAQQISLTLCNIWFLSSILVFLAGFGISMVMLSPDSPPCYSNYQGLSCPHCGGAEIEVHTVPLYDDTWQYIEDNISPYEKERVCKACHISWKCRE